MKNHLLVVGIIFLFLSSVVAPMTTGIDTDSEVDVELERMLDNLRYVCMGPDGFNSVKYEYYKEQLLSKYSYNNENNDIIEQEDKELSILVKQPSLSIASSGGPMDSPWPMHCHDVHHTGQSPYSTADNPYDEKWRFQTKWGIDTASAIDNNGTIYFGSGWEIWAIYLDGTLKWNYETNGVILHSNPAIAEDGTIYVGSWDTGLYAINPDGTQKWRFGSGGSISSSPVIGNDGSIYCAHVNGDIFAMNPNGTRKWRYKTGNDVFSDPCIGDDGTIYCGSNDNYLYALNPNGTLKWRFKTAKAVGGAPSIADDGTVYVAGTWDNYLYALYPNNGTIKWKCNIFVSCANPSIDNNGIIYVGSDEKLYAVYPNGTLKWSFDLGNERWIGPSAPAISADGTIYVGTNIGSGVEGGDIIAINYDGTLRWRKKIASDWVDSSPSIAKDGTVYIGTNNEGNDYFYAFGRAELEVDANGPYYGLIDEPLQFTGTSSGGHSPHSYLWEFGDTQTSEEQNPIHTYTSPDNYDVVLTVTDNKSNTEMDTTFAWIQESNTAPDKPTINGPIQGNVGVTYDYTFSAIDPDNSIVYIYVHWGDGSDTGWKGPYDSGQEVTFSHKWTTENTFTINAQAKDPYNAESLWETLDVTIPRDKSTDNMLFRLLERFPLIGRLLNIRWWNLE